MVEIECLQVRPLIHLGSLLMSVFAVGNINHLRLKQHVVPAYQILHEVH